jgi:hypothetical protein
MIINVYHVAINTKHKHRQKYIVNHKQTDLINLILSYRIYVTYGRVDLKFEGKFNIKKHLIHPETEIQGSTPGPSLA